jgi:hypothetical protein
MLCEDCERLWRAYENSVFEHVRLCSKLKLAIATNAQETACEDLAFEVSQAEGKRATTRAALLDHEASAGHEAPSVAVRLAL